MIAPPSQELAKVYDPRPVEERWARRWVELGAFASQPSKDKPAYTVCLPPPNVTGVLHMGHMLNATLQDVLVRRARMQGYEACWVPGTDHASIATEAKVVGHLREQGIDKKSLTREEFLEHAHAWKDRYGGIILGQLRRLGASCDWDRTRFTMEPALSQSVTDVFVALYDKGLIYRGHRMVNWDPVARTSVSDEEVIMTDEQGRLYYVRYPLEGGASWEQPARGTEGEEGYEPARTLDYLLVATTRPETILADVAVAVHPDDERYRGLVGARVRIPGHPAGKTIPIITDEAILREFGTGCLKVTPAHDKVDYEIAQRFAVAHPAEAPLEIIDLLTEEGRMAPAALMLAGQDRFEARKAYARLLEGEGLLERAEPYQNRVGRSERTQAIIEPRLSAQWFVRMADLAAPALEAVRDGRVRLHPGERFMGTYEHWMTQVRDWCISRQLWWGQRIPAWYLPDGRHIVAPDARTALRRARDQYQLFALSASDLRQDEDVVDTWFSSWLWPLSVFDYDFARKQGNEQTDFYYPTQVLITGPDILFFWVARMIMAGLEFHGQVPFRDVYLTGIVRDKQGRKLSKSLGNSPDPLELVERFGADGVRFGMLVASPAGNDLLFDERHCEQGRNFCNKLWNALRLLEGWQAQQSGGQSPPQDGETGPVDQTPQEQPMAVAWMQARLAQTLAQLEEQMAAYRLSEGLQTVYKLIWDDYCQTFLEMIKPPYGGVIGPDTLAAARVQLSDLCRVLHPFMPFITEEVWQALGRQNAHPDWPDTLCRAPWPTPTPPDDTLLEEGARALEAVSGLRAVRAGRGLSPRVPLRVSAKTGAQGSGSAGAARYGRMIPLMERLAGLAPVTFVDEAPAGAGIEMVLVGQDQFFVHLEGLIDPEAERAALAKEIEYLEGFLQSVEAKLGNEKFVARARPELVETERRKQADAQAKLAALRARLKA